MRVTMSTTVLVAADEFLVVLLQDFGLEPRQLGQAGTQLGFAKFPLRGRSLGVEVQVAAFLLIGAHIDFLAADPVIGQKNGGQGREHRARETLELGQQFLNRPGVSAVHIGDRAAMGRIVARPLQQCRIQLS